MNVFVMVDIEGISGIYSREQVLPGEPRFAEGRRYMTADINNCVKGLKAAGADKVYVCDCHGGSYSLAWDEIAPDCEADYYICGSTCGKRFYGIEDCDAVVLLGYHARAGADAAVLEHSWSSKAIQNIYLNGEVVGEIAFDAAIAAEYGKPIIMVSGDDKACKEAKEKLPWIVTAEVKKGISTYGAMLLPPQKAHNLIYEKSIEAVRNFENCKLLEYDKPIVCKVEVTERTSIPYVKNIPFMKKIDARTFETTLDSVEDIVYTATNL